MAANDVPATVQIAYLRPYTVDMTFRIDERVFEVAPHADPEEVGRLAGSEWEAMDSPAAYWAMQISRAAVEEVVSAIFPSYLGILGSLVEQAIQQQSLGLVAYLQGDDGALRLNPQHRATVVASVREEMPIYPGIIDGIRIVEKHWRRSFLSLVLDEFDRADALQILTQIEVALSRYFDTQIDRTGELYAEEAARLAESRAAGRRQLIDRLIAGEDFSAETVSQTLGIDVGGTHVGFVIAATRPTHREDRVVDFDAVAREFAKEFAGSNVLMVPAQDGTVWLWASGKPEGIADVSGRLESISNRVSGVKITAGNPATGAAGFRATHLMARVVNGIAEHDHSARTVRTFADFALPAILLRDLELAQWFIVQELGPILGHDVGLRDLRATLFVLIRNGGNITDTAEELFVHRNTIGYRMKRVQELLGRDPLKRPLETQAALALESLIDIDQ